MAPKQTETDEMEAVANAGKSLPDEDVLPAGEEQPVPNWVNADAPVLGTGRLNDLLDRAMAEALSDDDEDDDLFITNEDLSADAALTDVDLERLTRLPAVEDMKPGDVFIVATGEYRVNYMTADVVSLRQRINGVEVSIAVSRDDVANLLQAKGYEAQIDPIDDDQERCSECGKPLNYNDDDVCNDCLLGRALRAQGIPLSPTDEETQPFLDLKQFEHDPDLWSAATRLRYDGLLVDVAGIRLEGPPYNHAVVIKCRDEEGYNLIQAAMPRHLVQIGVRRELLEIVVRESLYDDHPQAADDALDLLDSTDDPLITALQTQLAEAAAENDRLRNEIAELRAAAADDAEAQTAMDDTERNIESLTLVFSDIERQTGDKRIAQLMAQGWWLVPHSEHFLVRTNAKGSQVIDHVLRFEYTASRHGRRTEAALAALTEPDDLPLIERPSAVRVSVSTMREVES